MPANLYIDFDRVTVIVTVSPAYALFPVAEHIYVNFVESPYILILYFGSAFGYNIVFAVIVAVYV